MARSVKSLEGFGKLVRHEQDAASEGVHPLDEARARFVQGARSGAQPRRSQARRWWAAAAAALLAAAVIALLLRPATPLSLEARTLTVGEWIRADTEVPIHFSDGTRVVLRPGAHAMVVNTTAVGARVRLERGEAAVAVVHTPQARWSFEVGPFEVRVTGTRFDVSWDPAREVFSLTLHEGSVMVSGPTIDGARAVGGGENLRIEVDPAPSAAASTPATSSIPAVAAPTATASSLAPAVSVAMAPSAPARASAPAVPRWKTLLAQGAFKEAYAAAHTAGFKSALASADAGDLFQLADAARYAGKPADAKRGYLAVRARFGGTPHAAHAAFALGRLDFPDTIWFARYLQEAPHGPFASEAMGRILEAQHALDDPAAEQTAARYLIRYPNGPHAALAKKLARPR